jgi:DNA-3-methyladenine glycosylase II
MNKKLNIRHPSIRKLSPSRDAFASLVRSIIYQQLSGKAAASIEKKFVAVVKRITPAAVLSLTDAQFQSAGVSTQKRGYLRDLAGKFIDGTIVPKHFPKMTDEEIREHLIRVKGIGRWTADMFLMFALNRLDVLPLGDLGIKKGFQKAFKLRSLPDERTMLKLAEQYAGERTQLSLYLWHILDNAGDTTW